MGKVFCATLAQLSNWKKFSGLIAVVIKTSRNAGSRSRVYHYGGLSHFNMLLLLSHGLSEVAIVPSHACHALELGLSAAKIEENAIGTVTACLEVKEI